MPQNKARSPVKPLRKPVDPLVFTSHEEKEKMLPNSPSTTSSSSRLLGNQTIEGVLTSHEAAQKIGRVTWARRMRVLMTDGFQGEKTDYGDLDLCYANPKSKSLSDWLPPSFRCLPSDPREVSMEQVSWLIFEVERSLTGEPQEIENVFQTWNAARPYFKGEQHIVFVLLYNRAEQELPKTLVIPPNTYIVFAPNFNWGDYMLAMAAEENAARLAKELDLLKQKLEEAHLLKQKLEEENAQLKQKLAGK
eukprot:TRINITY_DN5038_c0_g1_i4.p1 TRINITY_DN5038_c0_g1~~TRINITY_DN5038_c0_g1_i4.p1  ORF type:complete len:258 (+),score=47.45 TRINITY_DN5038_c0_g1_i4:30-776(+)